MKEMEFCLFNPLKRQSLLVTALCLLVLSSCRSSDVKSNSILEKLNESFSPETLKLGQEISVSDISGHNLKLCGTALVPDDSKYSETDPPSMQNEEITYYIVSDDRIKSIISSEPDFSFCGTTIVSGNTRWGSYLETYGFRPTIATDDIPVSFSGYKNELDSRLSACERYERAIEFSLDLDEQ